MPRYLFAVRHPAYAELEDDVCGMELPDHAAARELAAKVMRGLLRNRTGGGGQWKSGWTGVGCGIFRSMRYRGRPLIKLKALAVPLLSNRAVGCAPAEAGTSSLKSECVPKAVE